MLELLYDERNILQLTDVEWWLLGSVSIEMEMLELMYIEIAVEGSGVHDTESMIRIYDTNCVRGTVELTGSKCYSADININSK